MDPNTQQTQANTVSTANNTNQVIVGGAFGGTIPNAQNAIADTMPSFALDPDEYGAPLSDPFSGGFASTNISLDELQTPPQENNIVDAAVTENNTPDTSPVSTESSDSSMGFTYQNQETPPVIDTKLVSEPITSELNETVNENNASDFSFPDGDFVTLENLPAQESVAETEPSADTREPNILDTSVTDVIPSFDLPEQISEAQEPLADTSPELKIHTPEIEQQKTLDTMPSSDLPSEDTTLQVEPTQEIIEEKKEETIPEMTTTTESTSELKATQTEQATVSEIPSFDLPEQEVNQGTIPEVPSFDEVADVSEIEPSAEVSSTIPTFDYITIPGGTAEEVPSDMSIDTLQTPQEQEPLADVIPSFDLPEQEVNQGTIPEVPSFDEVADVTETEPSAEVSSTISTFDEVGIPEPVQEVVQEVEEITPEILPEPQSELNETETEQEPVSDIDSFDVPEETTNPIESQEVGEESPMEESLEIDEGDKEEDSEFIPESQPEEFTEHELDETTENNLADNLSEEETIPEDSTDDSIQEEWTDNTHDLTEAFHEFSTILSTYLGFLESDTVSIVGLRTQEDEVSYNFTKEYDDTIIVEKSNSDDTINFVPTDSGLEVLLNNESIAYYGVDKVSDDITHYLKEKLGKFTMMIESEYDKQRKAQREEAKKIKETLRNF